MCCTVPDFDVPRRTIIVDQEKSIDTAFDDVVKHAHLFLDPLHVKKNMSPHLGTGKAKGISQYEKAVRAPSREEVNKIVDEYSPSQARYLGKFPKSRLYAAYSHLEYGVVTSQAAESQMNASLRNQIRTVEPQKMLMNVVLTQRRNFLQHKNRVSSYDKPVPPHIE